MEKFLNRSYTKWSLEQEVGNLYASFVMASATTLASAQGGGIASIDVVSSTEVKLNLSNAYHKLLFADAIVVSATSAGKAVKIKSADVKNAKQVTLVFDSALATDDEVLVKLDVRKTNVGPFDNALT